MADHYRNECRTSERTPCVFDCTRDDEFEPYEQVHAFQRNVPTVRVITDSRENILMAVRIAQWSSRGAQDLTVEFSFERAARAQNGHEMGTNAKRQPLGWRSLGLYALCSLVAGAGFEPTTFGL